jgi:hypothetical protein
LFKSIKYKRIYVFYLLIEKNQIPANSQIRFVANTNALLQTYLRTESQKLFLF